MCWNRSWFASPPCMYDPGGDSYKCVPLYDCIWLLYLDEAVHGFECWLIFDWTHQCTCLAPSAGIATSSPTHMIRFSDIYPIFTYSTHMVSCLFSKTHSKSSCHHPEWQGQNCQCLQHRPCLHLPTSKFHLKMSQCSIWGVGMPAANI